MIKIEDVTKTFGKNEKKTIGLQNVDLEMSAGEFVAFAGPSGSGKTTLLNIIGSLDRPDSGRIIFRGDDITDFSEKKASLFRRENIGFVFQDSALMPELTVFENVEMPLALTKKKPEERRKRVFELLEMINLADRSKSFPDDLSAGEKQRVSLARAVAADPSVILADEPTANLDKENAEIVLGILKSFSENDILVVVASHDARVIDKCDRVVQLSDGRITV